LIVIEADNITSWNVIESVNGSCEWVDPEIRLVTAAELAEPEPVAISRPPARDYDSGPSIAEVQAVEYDWTGQEYWLWT
jgi:hypothetical protein